MDLAEQRGYCPAAGRVRGWLHSLAASELSDAEYNAADLQGDTG